MPTSELEKLLAAIELCLKSRFITPALILIYSTTDIMAWLDRDPARPDVTRGDFIRWVDTYLLPGSGLSCLAVDLYAARCSILHSYSAESLLTRKGDAKDVFYAWGDRKAADLQQAIDALGKAAVAVHVDELFTALRKAIDAFLFDIESDPRREALFDGRLRKWFSHVS